MEWLSDLDTSQTWDDLIDDIKNSDGKKIADLTLKELVFDGDKFTGNGVYILKDHTKKIRYIGKATSRPFVERLAGHLDLREVAGFNNVLVDIVEVDLNEEVTNDTLRKAGNQFMDYSIILLRTPWDREGHGQHASRVVEQKLIYEFYKEYDLFNYNYTSNCKVISKAKDIQEAIDKSPIEIKTPEIKPRKEKRRKKRK